jgi:heptosyltransferase I
VPLPADARAYAAGIVTDARPTLLISPCSSHTLRNWRPDRYAAVADHAAATHGMRVVLVGGRSSLEMRMGEQISAAARVPLLNQIGKDTLPQLLGLMAASTALLVAGFRSRAHGHHGGTAGDRTVCRHPHGSRRPLLEPRLVRRQVRRCRPKVLRQVCNQVAWTLKIEKPGVMDLISVQEVIAKLDALLAALKPADPLKCLP